MTRTCPTCGSSVPGPTVAIQRWTPGRKLEIVNDIRRGRMVFDEAVAEYGLSDEELQGWLDGVRARGLDGLKVTQLQAGR